jgi:choice-of-anchor B domain-containing protein
MRNTIALLLTLLSAPAVFSQNGLHLLKTFDHKHGTTSGVSYSGSWGYVGPDGREYAILGTATGTAIIEITDTANIHEIAHVAGPTSIWREMRTYKDHLYIVSEGGLGVQIVDLSLLPNSIDLVRNFVYTSGTKNTAKSHTIEIFDGYMYLNGCANWYPGGVLIFSLADLNNPQYLGEYQPPGTGNQRYVHDCYVRHDTIYAASIYQGGGLNIGSVANKAAPAHIATISYDGSGTHNVWTTSDGRYAITTDEIGNTVKSLKIWDLSSIPTPPPEPTTTYQFNPSDIEHNVFVRGKYAYVAYYTAGIVVVDMGSPETPATAGWYDTSTLSGYEGVWAVYPYFWSGKVTAGDMQNGLYIFTFDSLQARTPTSLFEPADQIVMCSGDPLTFRWSRVADPAQDPLQYWLRVKGPSIDSTFKVGTDTSFTLANPGVLGTGTFSWQLITVDEANQISSQDTFTFVRPGPAVAAPNGGESFKIFSQVPITWNWQCTDSLDLSYSTNNGSTWIDIARVPASPGSYPWNVPATPTSQARIRVRDVADTTRIDISNAAFTIFNSASITLADPNGGEVWQGGSVQQIVWSSTLVDSLRIEFSTDAGANWSTIVADTTASIGSYDWTVPLSYIGAASIRLVDLYNNTVFDESDATFAVALTSFDVTGGWNLVSIPVTPDNPDASTNFPHSVSHAFAYEASYVEADTVSEGVGYWIKYNEARTLPALGPLITSDAFPLASRWNLIGSISSPVAVSSASVTPVTNVLSNFFGYSADSGYTIADTIKPGRGYWVKASLPGELILSSSFANPSTRITIVPTSELPPAPPDEQANGGDRTSNIPTVHLLSQNYPNPFNPTTDFGLRIAEGGFVSLKIFDLLGREVSVLENEAKEAGYYTLTWNALNSPSGMYYARLTVTDASGKPMYRETKKIVLTK